MIRDEKVSSKNVQRYRKKPVVIEAIQLLHETWGDTLKFLGKHALPGAVYFDEKTFELLPAPHVSNIIGVRIQTLEGVMLGRQGDYIIKGVRGEFYPCKQDIFEQTYEQVINES